MAKDAPQPMPTTSRPDAPSYGSNGPYSVVRGVLTPMSINPGRAPGSDGKGK